ncbi:bacteriocin [Lactobacillus gasseri]|nr:bacteriocin [Lactobacillus gasseri]
MKVLNECQLQTVVGGKKLVSCKVRRNNWY